MVDEPAVGAEVVVELAVIAVTEKWGRGFGELTSPEVRRKQIVSAEALTGRLIHDGTYGL